MLVQNHTELISETDYENPPIKHNYGASDPPAVPRQPGRLHNIWLHELVVGESNE